MFAVEVQMSIYSNFLTVVRWYRLREGNDKERQALITFYRATGGDCWARNEGWCTNAPLDEWFGVETDYEGNVTSLTLKNNDLNGEKL